MFTTTPDEAREIFDNRSNGGFGRVAGTSDSKGGRVWLDGEFQLDELEALCIILRAEAGEAAEGVDELQAIYDQDARGEGKDVPARPVLMAIAADEVDFVRTCLATTYPHHRHLLPPPAIFPPGPTLHDCASETP